MEEAFNEISTIHSSESETEENTKRFRSERPEQKTKPEKAEIKKGPASQKKDAEKLESTEKKEPAKTSERRRERTRSPVRRSGYLGLNYDWRKDPKNRDYDLGSRQGDYNSANQRYSYPNEFERGRNQGRNSERGRGQDQRSFNRQLCGQTVFKNEEPERNEKWLGSMGQTANQIFLEKGDFKSCIRKIENQQITTNQAITAQVNSESTNNNGHENIYSKCLVYCEINANLREQLSRNEVKMAEWERNLRQTNEKEENAKKIIEKMKIKIQELQQTNQQRSESPNEENQQLKKERDSLKTEIKKRDAKLKNATERYAEIEKQLAAERENRKKADDKVNNFIDTCTCNSYLFN